MSDPPKNGSKNGPVLVNVFVSFREVDRIYDLHGHRSVLGTPTDPIPVTDMSAAIGDVRGMWTNGQPRYLGEDGKSVHSSKIVGEMPGMYQGIRIDNYDAELRTFARGKAAPIEGKFAYVFSSTADDHSDLKLVRELQFEKGGQFRLVDLVTDAGKDERKGSGTAASVLVIPVMSVKGPSDATSSKESFYVLLAPYQLPWASLVAMQKAGKGLASRAMRLFDWFWTDALVGGAARTVFELPSSLKTAPLEFVLYLVDPLKEGVQRGERYAIALEAWEREHEKMGADKVYAYAKRIEQITERTGELQDLVKNELWPYLQNKEGDLQRRHAHALDLLADLLRWVGYMQSRDGMSFGDIHSNHFISGDTFYSNGVARAAVPGPSRDRARVNPFSNMVRDFLPVQNDAWVKVLGVVLSVIGKMNNLPAGEAFLSEIAMKGVDESQEHAADAGGEMFFQFMRKTAATGIKTVVERHEVQEGWAKLMTVFGRHVVHEGDAALERMIAIARERLAIKLNKVQPASLRKHRKALEKQRVGKLRNLKDKHERLEKLAEHYHLKVDDDRSLTGETLSVVGLAFEVFNLYYSVRSFTNDPTVLGGLDLVGSAADAYSAAIAVFPKVKLWKIGSTKLEVFSRPVELLSGTIDFIVGLAGMVSATNFGQQVGHGMRTVGAALTVVGTGLGYTPFAPVGVVIGIIGLGLEALGSWILTQSSDWQLFLRHSQWGHRSTLDKELDAHSDKNGFGYKGSLAKLKDSLEAQVAALDDLVWGFEPTFVVDAPDGSGYRDLYMYVGARAGLGNARWYASIEVTVDSVDVPVTTQIDYDETLSAVLGMGMPVYLTTLPRSRQRIAKDDDMDIDIDGTRLRASLSVKANVVLDVSGDNSHLVNRDHTLRQEYD